MKREILRYTLSITLLTGLVLLAACGGGVDTERSESEREIPEEPAEGEDIEDLPEVVVPVGDAYTFVLTIHKVGHSTSQGENMVIEEQADIVVVGNLDLLHGIGKGPAHFSPNVNDLCNMECSFEMEFDVKGYFNPSPECSLFLKVHPNPLPGECTTECGPLNVIPYAGGIYDALVDEVTFEGHEIGMEKVTQNKVVLDKQLGTAQWTNQFEIKYFVGDLSSIGCIFDF